MMNTSFLNIRKLGFQKSRKCVQDQVKDHVHKESLPLRDVSQRKISNIASHILRN